MNLTRWFLMVSLIMLSAVVLILGPTVESPSALREIATLTLLCFTLAGLYIWMTSEE